MRWPLTFYPAKLSGNQLGNSRFCFIWVLRDYKSSEAIYQHELTHVKQWACVSLAAVAGWFALCTYVPELRPYANLAVFGLVLDQTLYTVLPAYRQWAEVQAYKVQVKWGGSAEACALSLSRDYKLNLTQEQALQLLKR